MAYKYDDFITAANNAGMMGKFSQKDLAATQKNPEYGLSMLSLMKDYDASETEEQRLLATEAANQLRKTYGTYDNTAPLLHGGANQSMGSFSGSAVKAPTLHGSAGNNQAQRLSISGRGPVSARMVGGAQKVGGNTGAVAAPMLHGGQMAVGGSGAVTAPQLPGVPNADNLKRTFEGSPQIAPQIPGVPNPNTQKQTFEGSPQVAPQIPGVPNPNTQKLTFEGTPQTAPQIPGVPNPNNQQMGMEGTPQSAPMLPGEINPAPQDQNGYAGTYEQAIAQALGLVGNYGDYTYANEDAYQQLLQKILNPEAFTYDPETDARFSSYKKTYLREGDRATANALARAAAATGGVPSSYAATAAAQAGNYYAGQVADVIPQLYNDAYNQYMNEFQMQLSGLGALQDDRNFGYQEYLDKYNMLQNNLDNLQQQDQTEYDRYMDQWNMGRTEENDAYDRALAQYEMLGYATPEIAEILGINADLNQKQVLALQKAMNSMGANIATDGILGNQTWEAFQKMGYMDAWPAYKAMMQAGLIDAEGNYTGSEVGYSNTGSYQSPEDDDDDPIDTSYTDIKDKVGEYIAQGKSREQILNIINAAVNENLISQTQYRYLVQLVPNK